MPQKTPDLFSDPPDRASRRAVGSHPDTDRAAEGRWAEGAIVGVLTTQPLDRVLDYRAPEGGVGRGDFVEVPLGPRKVIGIVWGEGRGDWDPGKVRTVMRRLDVPPMTDELREFLERAAAYTLTPLPAMLRLATRVPGLGQAPSMMRVYRRGEGVPPRMTDPRARVIEAADGMGGLALTLKELADMAGVTTSVVKGLVTSGAILEEQAPRDTAFPRLDPERGARPLTEEQQAAARLLRDGQARDAYRAVLLRGVTGSGKTEVYLEAVAEAIRQGRQVLVLLPEIALTSEFLTRVEARFGAAPAEWHSGVTMTERRRVWRMVAEGRAQMVIGARSALYLPYQRLGLIVVDEEHDTSYKQEDGVLYNARDMAVLRAAHAGAQVILASATPSLESWANAEAGKYARVTLTARFGPQALPRMAAVDMRSEDLAPGTWLSPALVGAISRRLDAGEQSLIFLNRRGYAPVTLCRACGMQVACAHCDARMVEHRFLKRLLCHQCGDSTPVPQSCPSCSVEGKMAAVGPGVERLAEEIAAQFPDARSVVLSSDLYGSGRELKARIEEIAAGGADIIIGTQLVAKGHNFPLLTLVGVVDADLGLQGSDLRAAERTFQLMRQVAGRAGRADRPGEALLQTYQPDHPVIRAILGGQEDAFWNAELAERRAAGMPPFGRLAGIILSGSDVARVFDLGNVLARRDAPLRRIGAEVYGPAPAPIARVRGRHRVRLLVKAPKSAPLQSAITDWVSDLSLKGDLCVTIDIDPQSFF